MKERIEYSEILKNYQNEKQNFLENLLKQIGSVENADLAEVLSICDFEQEQFNRFINVMKESAQNGFLDNDDDDLVAVAFLYTALYTYAKLASEQTLKEIQIAMETELTRALKKTKYAFATFKESDGKSGVTLKADKEDIVRWIKTVEDCLPHYLKNIWFDSEKVSKFLSKNDDWSNDIFEWTLNRDSFFKVHLNVPN